MTRETMTSEERVWAAMRLEKPDRVPIAILATAAPLARLGGISIAQFYSDGDKADETISKVFDECGGWDLDLGSLSGESILMNKVIMSLVQGMKLEYPGLELPDDYSYQAREQEVLKREDYDTIADIGWEKFMMNDFIFRLVDITPDQLKGYMDATVPRFFKGIEAWNKRGVVTMYPPTLFTNHPFFRLSLSRSMIKFTEDLHTIPDKVERALKKMTAEFIETEVTGCKLFNSKKTLVTEEHAGPYFHSPKIFDRFWWPYTLEIVNALSSEGIVSWFHLDCTWDRCIPYFKQLPRGSAVLAFDGTTDIFAAKKALRNHLCIAGDVGASLLSLGKPEEVEAYCKRLIDELGGDGGYILCSGCEVPEAVKMENLKAMIKTGKTYELSGKRKK